MLLDDGSAPEGIPASRLYLDHDRTLACTGPGDLDWMWAQVEAAQRGGLHAVLLADYEWGARVVGAGGDRWPAPGLAGEAPALRVLLFHTLRRMDRAAVDAWLAAAEGREAPAPAGPMDLRTSRDRAAFARDLDRIQAHLQAGDTYQVNHTLRLAFRAHGEPLSLYRRLRARQPVAYGALAALEGGGWVLSCSPELFVRLEGSGEARRLVVRPMKGTAPPGAGGPLGADRKTQAENVMIVDLLRNDLGRVAATGTVQVQRLFTVEDYPTLQQLTSTIAARPRAGLRFPDILRAMFPCGSVTGAPKHRTMQLIADLEGSPRGLYCGALGWVDPPPPGEALGDFCLSVAIRTLELGALPAGGTPRPGRLGVGAGIVLGSRADAEYDETLLKAAFLTELDPGFALLETLRMEGDGRVPLLPDHLARMGASAQVFGFPWEPAALEAALRAAVRDRAFPGPGALRVTLARDGCLEVTLRALEPPWEGGAGAAPVSLGVDPVPLAVDPVLSRHKTTWRPRYDAGLALARARGWFDLLYLDAAGRVVEGARSTLFVKRDGGWITPPLEHGALPGVQRARALLDPALGVREATVSLEDLRRAEALMVGNALRGLLPARLAAPLPEGGPG